MSDRTSLLSKIQQLGFTLIDTGLYLNAYNCPEAFEHGMKIKEKYDLAVKEYTEKYGPLTAYRGLRWIVIPRRFPPLAQKERARLVTYSAARPRSA